MSLLSCFFLVLLFPRSVFFAPRASMFVMRRQCATRTMRCHLRSAVSLPWAQACAGVLTKLWSLHARGVAHRLNHAAQVHQTGSSRGRTQLYPWAIFDRLATSARICLYYKSTNSTGQTGEVASERKGQDSQAYLLHFPSGKEPPTKPRTPKRTMHASKRGHPTANAPPPPATWAPPARQHDRTDDAARDGHLPGVTAWAISTPRPQTWRHSSAEMQPSLKS